MIENVRKHVVSCIAHNITHHIWNCPAPYPKRIIIRNTLYCVRYHSFGASTNLHHFWIQIYFDYLKTRSLFKQKWATMRGTCEDLKFFFILLTLLPFHCSQKTILEGFVNNSPLPKKCQNGSCDLTSRREFQFRMLHVRLLSGNHITEESRRGREENRNVYSTTTFARHSMQ